jgi:hypothetical protein
MATRGNVKAPPTERDISLAKLCESCPVCRKARRDQRGIIFWFVKFIEGGICPSCKAYEKVHGRKAHEAVGKIF